MFKRALARPFSFFNLTIRRTVPLAVVFLLIEFFDELYFAVEGAVLPALRQDLGITYAQIGLLLGLPQVIGVFIEPVLMLLGDTRLRKGLVVGGGLVVVASLFLIAGASTFLTVLVAFTLSFPASGAFVSLAQATLIDMNAGREAHWMARWTAAGSLGNLAGPLLVAAGFALALGWRWVFAVLALFALLLVAFVARRPFPTRLYSTHDSTSHHAETLKNLWESLRSALRNRELLRWVGLLQLSDLLLDVFTGYAALYFSDVMGATPAQASLLLTVLMLSSLLADLGLIPLLERMPGRKVVRISAAFGLVVYAAWLLVPSPLAKAILLPAVRLTTIGWYPVLQGEAYAAEPGRSGTVSAIVALSGLLGGVLTWFIGWFAGEAGLATAMWLLILAPAGLALLVPRPEIRSADAR